MNPVILSPEVQQYLHAQETASPADVALRKSPFDGVSSLELAQQLDARQRCRKKLPRWYEPPGIYYPEKLSVEQASSQITARYKADLIPSGKHVIDLTGGMGVDTFFFAHKSESVVYCERNEALVRIAQHNAVVLGAHNLTFVPTDGLTYLQNQPADRFDCIYIDPSRRVGQRKVFRLADCEPNVVEAQGWLLQKAPRMLIKSAPLLDISAALNELEQVREVHIVSVDNECKELLFVIERGYRGVPRIVAAALGEASTRVFSFGLSEERAAAAPLGAPEKYLYEPDAALLKSGAFKLIAQSYGLRKLHMHTHLYTSTQLVSDFIGRIFRVNEAMEYSDFKRNKKAVSAHVNARNFPLKAEALRKRHRVLDGGDQYLFFCTGADARLLVIFASKC